MDTEAAERSDVVYTKYFIFSPCFFGDHAVTKDSTSSTSGDKGVLQGWKINCDSLPCQVGIDFKFYCTDCAIIQQLLPGSLGTGGIISVEGTFNTCFDLILGDDALTISPTSFAGIVRNLTKKLSMCIMFCSFVGFSDLRSWR